MARFYWFYPPVARFYTWFWGGCGAVLQRFQAALLQPRQMQASRAGATQGNRALFRESRAQSSVGVVLAIENLRLV